MGYDFLKLSGNKNVKVSDLTQIPSCKKRFSPVIRSQKLNLKKIYNLAFQSEKNLLKEVDLFDVYEGDKLPEGKKSYAVSFLIARRNKTLRRQANR